MRNEGETDHDPGSVLEAVSALGYGMASTPLQAAVAYAVCDSASQVRTNDVRTN
jgi:cell division protein FtsI/penicillin-binding protein 2